MKKDKVYMLLFSIAALYAGGVQADNTNGRLLVHGSIWNETCAISPESQNISLALPGISAEQLEMPGQEAGKTAFDIHISNCPQNIMGVGIHFSAEGAGFNAQTGNFTNASINQDAAKNVEVRLYESDGTVIHVGDSSRINPVANGETTLRYLMGYYATGRAVAGNVEANVVYTLAYQ